MSLAVITEIKIINFKRDSKIEEEIKRVIRVKYLKALFPISLSLYLFVLKYKLKKFPFSNFFYFYYILFLAKLN